LFKKKGNLEKRENLEKRDNKNKMWSKMMKKDNKKPLKKKSIEKLKKNHIRNLKRENLEYPLNKAVIKANLVNLAKKMHPKLMST